MASLSGTSKNKQYTWLYEKKTSIVIDLLA